MKSPAELSHRLARQWENADLRESRLLDSPSWPLTYSIGAPPPAITHDITALKSHLESWRAVKAGTVFWQSKAYRTTDGAIEIPSQWQLNNANEWLSAAVHPPATKEFQKLNLLLENSDPLFHRTFVRQRSLWKDIFIEEALQATRLALEIEPGQANGAPLRALSLAGIDSKFFERHRSLIIRLLDLRFDGEVSRQGLEAFLGAWQENDHWLLLADLDGSILPFARQRVRSSELFEANLNPSNLLIVENERCLHLLPKLPETLAVLGAGNNLSWLTASWVQYTKVAYWGDNDTWGLTMLASARGHHPFLEALLMEKEIFIEHQEKAVPESVTAASTAPNSLLSKEKELYYYLLSCERGRLEQEFLPKEIVQKQILNWHLTLCP